jgi:uncharacterized membrane protein YeaQ/YmgE (transglycosylase-associated protein family)
VVGFLVYLVAVGVAAGSLAGPWVPHARPAGPLRTALVAIAGSFGGGFLGYTLSGGDFREQAFQPGGFLGSIVGATVALVAHALMARPADPARRRSTRS